MDTLEKRLANLELEFLNNRGVKPYQLEQIFTINQSKKIFHSVNVEIKEGKEEGFHPYVVRSSINNGIKGFISESEEFLNPGNTITFAQDTFFAFYQKNSFFTGNGVKVLALKNKEMTEELGLFLAANINFKIKDLSWGVGANMKSISEIVIHLPTLSNGELAYEYMENYIKEIEAYHVKEIEAYLKATGLSSYELSKDEVESLKTISMGGGRKFTLDELFEKLELKFLKKEFNKEKDISKEQTKEFNIPLVNAKAGNNGIMYYGREKDFETAELTLDIVNDGAISTGMVYPQIHKTGVLYNAYLIKPKFKHNRNLLLYFAGVVQKSIQAKFSYENKAGWNKVKEEEINLPVNSNNEIDFHLVETYIKATQKLTIKDLVDNINKKLETYKDII